MTMAHPSQGHKVAAERHGSVWTVLAWPIHALAAVPGGRLIDTVEAQRHDPMLVKRLRRLRDARTHARAHSAVGG